MIKDPAESERCKDPNITEAPELRKVEVPGSTEWGDRDGAGNWGTGWNVKGGISLPTVPPGDLRSPSQQGGQVICLGALDLENTKNSRENLSRCSESGVVLNVTYPQGCLNSSSIQVSDAQEQTSPDSWTRAHLLVSVLPIAKDVPSLKSKVWGCGNGSVDKAQTAHAWEDEFVSPAPTSQPNGCTICGPRPWKWRQRCSDKLIS